MKGKLVKINGEWMVEYDHHHVHAGISKMGTGPGVGKKITEKKRLPIHISAIGIKFIEEKEIEFEELMVFIKTGQCMAGEVEGYNMTFARIINKEEPQENWDEIFQDVGQYESLADYLKKNYLPPKRIKS